MPISDIPILSMLRERMEWHQERQRVLAENVANADTSNYQAKDLAPPDFEREVSLTSVSLATHRTRPHIGVERSRLAVRDRQRRPVTRCGRAATR